MGMQPIDLQNMYSQMSNIARNVAGQQQAAQVSEQIQHQNQVQKNIEQSQRVQQASNDKAKSNSVNPDGHQGSSGGGGTYKNPNKQTNDGSKKDTNFGNYGNVKPEYVGTIVDITR